MIFKHCANCSKKTAHKRAFGAGTVIGFFVTLGLWILVMPFYPVRCTVCGMKGMTTDRPETESSRRMAGQLITVFLVLLILFSLYSFMGFFWP